MKELYVFCEGRTEQVFCKQVLQGVVFPAHDGIVHSIPVANSRSKGVVHRGGLRSYLPVKNDIVDQLNATQRPNVFFTSMIDLYALPNDFPGRADVERNPSMPVAYVSELEERFTRDVGDPRFFGYIQLHEFETLLYSNLGKLRSLLDGFEKEITTLTGIADKFPTIEHINEGYETCPSRRIYKLIPPYEALKASVGPAAAKEIGISMIREKCPHFNEWVTKMESLWN